MPDQPYPVAELIVTLNARLEKECELEAKRLDLHAKMMEQEKHRLETYLQEERARFQAYMDNHNTTFGRYMSERATSEKSMIWLLRLTVGGILLLAGIRLAEMVGCWGADMPANPTINFTVVEEGWSRWRLPDGTIVRAKFVLQKVRALQDGNSFHLDVLPHVFVLSDALEISANPPRKIYSQEEVKRNVVGHQLIPTPIELAPSRYELGNGGHMSIQTNVTAARRTKLVAPDGEPIYDVTIRADVEVNLPDGFFPTPGTQ